MLWKFLIINLFWIVLGQQCGDISGRPNLTGKIVGGYNVGYYKYPFFASLTLKGEAWCGGTLLSKNIVVSAAHCYKDFMNKNKTSLESIYKVKLGVYNKCIKEETQKVFNVKKVHIHEKYLKLQPYYDIAILVLEEEANNYQPACLPVKALTSTTRGKEGIIIGLGTTKYGADKYPCELHEGRILLYPDTVCKNMIMNATDDKEDYAFVHAFCGGYMEGGVDACQGDSGGPVFVQQFGKFVVIGITSFGYDCAQKNLLGIYTDISHYLDWIREKTGVQSTLQIGTATKPPDEVMPTKPPEQIMPTAAPLLPPSEGTSTIDKQMTPTTEMEDTTPTTPHGWTNDKPPAGETDFPVFPFTYPMTLKPPIVYRNDSAVSSHHDSDSILKKWPPRRIIIEYKRKHKKHKHQKSTRKHWIDKKRKHQNRNHTGL